MDKIMIGMAKENITPPTERMNLAGMDFYRISTHVESPIYANVFAAEEKGEQLIICSCDVVAIRTQFGKRILELVSNADSSINTDKIILAATHTHNSPYTDNPVPYNIMRSKYLPEGITYEDNFNTPEDAWMGDKTSEYLAQHTTKAIVKAWQSRKKGYFSPAFGRIPLGTCRRVEYKDGTAINYGITNSAAFKCIQGGSDSGAELLYLFDENREPIGAIVNIACPAQSLERNTFVSSDFWGKARDFIEQEMGADFVTVGLCGAAGDQAPRDQIRLQRPNWYVVPMTAAFKRREDAGEVYSIERTTDVGETISIEVLRRLKKAKETLFDSADINHDVIMMELPRLIITNEQNQKAKEEVTEYIKKCGKTQLDDRDMGVLSVALATIKRYTEQETDRLCKFKMNVVRFGDTVFASNPFELFLDFGNQIKARSRAAQTFLIQLANDSFNYLPTEVAQKSGGYGAVPHVVQVGWNGGELLVEKTVDMINSMWIDS